VVLAVLPLALPSIPVAAGIAILKYRLYDIDVVINSTLVYGSLTTALALTYFGGVATTQAIFRALTGQEQQPQLAIVVSTLVIAALFNPLRRQVQAFVDRRFYRRKYDAAKTLAAFSAKLRDETDLEALNSAPLSGWSERRCNRLTSLCGCVPIRFVRVSRTDRHIHIDAFIVPH
jgi:ADP-ribosylglycohydrolase